MTDNVELNSFLTGARGREWPEPAPTPDGGLVLVHEQDGFRYVDTWYGHGRFAGNVLVSESGVPVYVMQYCGRVQDLGELTVKEVLDFRKRALASDAMADRAIDENYTEDGFTFRTWTEYQEGSFHGEESIYHEPTRNFVYIGDFFGLYLRPE